MLVELVADLGQMADLNIAELFVQADTGVIRQCNNAVAAFCVGRCQRIQQIAVEGPAVSPPRCFLVQVNRRFNRPFVSWFSAKPGAAGVANNLILNFANDETMAWIVELFHPPETIVAAHGFQVERDMRVQYVMVVDTSECLGISRHGISNPERHDKQHNIISKQAVYVMCQSMKQLHTLIAFPGNFY